MKNRFLFLVAVVATVSAQAQTWNFSTDAQGWQVVDRIGTRSTGYVNVGDQFYAPDWSATGGQTAGYISHVDPSANTFFFISPQNLGDYSAFSGGTLNFSLNCDSPINYGLDNYLVLRSGSDSLYAQITPLPTQNSWTSYSIGLVAANFRDLANNNINQSQLNSVLASLGSLEISAEYTVSPPFEITGLDSVSFQAVPEPTALQLLAGTGTLLGFFFRRKR